MMLSLPERVSLRNGRKDTRNSSKLATTPSNVIYRAHVIRATLAPVRVPAFGNLAFAYLVNELGNWLGEIALAVLVYDQTRSPMATAALFCAMHFAPALIVPALVARVETGPVRL